MRRLSALLLIIPLVTGCDSGESGEPPEPAPAPKPRPSPAITRAELVEHLAALQRIARDHGGNRSAGTPGYDASADYVDQRLREAGWTVRREPVPFTYFQLRRASVAVGGRRLTRAKDFQVLSYSGSGRARGILRAAADGCTSEDFAAVAPGEIPLVGRGVCFFRDKARNAQRAGAEAVVVSGPVESRRGVAGGTLGAPGIRIPVVVISDRALGDSGEGSEARVAVDAISRGGRTENVIAETPGGSGDRIVMAGGHLDSVAGGPGINDNGSGTATLIEAAEAIGPKPPGARVRLGFWAAEELGLLGSRRYVSSLDDAERDRIRAYLNVDMAGSPNPVAELYGDGAPGLARILRRTYRGRLGETLAGQASDHAPFKSAGIPVNGLYTGATELGRGSRPRDPCYHLACDTLRNVNRAILLRMARATAHALETLSARHK